MDYNQQAILPVGLHIPAAAAPIPAAAVPLLAAAPAAPAGYIGAPAAPRYRY